MVGGSLHNTRPFQLHHWIIFDCWWSQNAESDSHICFDLLNLNDVCRRWLENWQVQSQQLWVNTQQGNYYQVSKCPVSLELHAIAVRRHYKLFVQTLYTQKASSLFYYKEWIRFLSCPAIHLSYK